MHELVRLVRVSGAPVFLDVDSIRTGSKWEEEIERAIHAAEALVVFWTFDAAKSEAVAKEIRIALSLGKDIVPVILEEVDLPSELAQYQGVVLTDLTAPHSPSFDFAPYVALLVERLVS